MCDQQNLRSACAYTQSDQSLCLSLDYFMIVKLLTAHHLEFLSLKVGCRDFSESTLVKMSNCWKSDAAAQFCVYFLLTRWVIGHFTPHVTDNILQIKNIEDIQMFLLNMSFISRVKWTIFIFHEWRSHE